MQEVRCEGYGIGLGQIGVDPMPTLPRGDCEFGIGDRQMPAAFKSCFRRERAGLEEIGKLKKQPQLHLLKKGIKC